MGLSRVLSLPQAALRLAQVAQGAAGALIPADLPCGHGSQTCGPFDRCIDGLNRLPRPLLTLGVLGLFGFAMVEPDAFGRRMLVLQLMPEPLWWLVGAVVTFYFGARERHYLRRGEEPVAPVAPVEPGGNPALAALGRAD